MPCRRAGPFGSVNESRPLLKASAEVHITPTYCTALILLLFIIFIRWCESRRLGDTGKLLRIVLACFLSFERVLIQVRADCPLQNVLDEVKNSVVSALAIVIII